jgi:hypothetical protein
MAEAFTDRSTRIPEPLAFEERYEVVGLERSTPTIVELWLRPLGEVLVPQTLPADTCEALFYPFSL